MYKHGFVLSCLIWWYWHIFSLPCDVLCYTFHGYFLDIEDNTWCCGKEYPPQKILTMSIKLANEVYHAMRTYAIVLSVPRHVPYEASYLSRQMEHTFASIYTQKSKRRWFQKAYDVVISWHMLCIHQQILKVDDSACTIVYILTFFRKGH